jgi:hypothetical protein
VAGENVVGSVQIVITGDTSRLQADFASAAQIAQRAGGTISASFTSGFAPGVAATSRIVDQFGRSVASVGNDAAKAAAPVATLEDVLAQLAETNKALIASIGALGAAHERAEPKVARGAKAAKDLADANARASASADVAAAFMAEASEAAERLAAVEAKLAAETARANEALARQNELLALHNTALATTAGTSPAIAGAEQVQAVARTAASAVDAAFYSAAAAGSAANRAFLQTANAVQQTTEATRPFQAQISGSAIAMRNAGAASVEFQGELTGSTIAFRELGTGAQTSIGLVSNAAAGAVAPLGQVGLAANQAAINVGNLGAAGAGGAGGGAGIAGVGNAAAGAVPPVRNLGTAANSTAVNMLQLYAAIRVVLGLAREFDKFRESEEKLSHLSAATGIAAERIAAFGGAVNLAGGDADKTGATIDRLARAMEAAKESGGAVADDLKRLGVAGEGLKDPIEALYQIADTVHNTSDKFAALEAAERVTGRSSSDLIGILGEGRAALEANAAASRDYASALAGAIGPSHELTVAENQLKQALATVAGEAMPSVVTGVKEIASSFELALLPVKALIDTIIYGFLSVSHTLEAQGTVIADALKGNWGRINADAAAGIAILRSDLNKFTDDLKKDADETEAFINKLHAPVAAPTPGAGKPFAPPGDIGNKVAVAGIDEQIAAIKRREAEENAADDIAIEKAKLVADARIKSTESNLDPTQRVIALANEEVQVARDKAARIVRINADAEREISLLRQRGAAEQSGKSPRDQEVIRQKTQSDIEAVQSQARIQTGNLSGGVQIAQLKANEVAVDAVRKATEELHKEDQKLFDELGKGWEQAAERIAKYQEEVDRNTTRAREYEDQASGNVKDLQYQGQKLKLEQQYAAEIAHSHADEIAQLQQINALENAARQAKITGQQQKLAELGPAVNLDQPGLSKEDSERGAQQARIAGQIAQLQAEASNANIAAKTKENELAQKQNELLQAQIVLAQSLTNWAQINLGTIAKDFADATVKLPGEIGNALAAGIFQAPKKGESKGQEIGGDLVKAVKSAGQQLLGNLITQAIEKLISELIGQAAVAALQTSSTQALIASNATVVGALAANTAAQGAGAGASAAGGIAGGVGSAAGSVAGGAATGFIGPLISAAGGIIGGIISSITTWAGDAKIVAAVNGTTAAVNALGTRLGPDTSTSGTGATASNSSLQTPTNAGSFNPFVNLLNGITAAGALPVSVVSISPIAPLAGIFKLFGFEGGGTPAIGVPALGGERGPEIGVSHATGAMSMIGARGPQIFTPREKMSIVPNHMAGAFLASRGMKGYADGAALSHFSSHTEKLYSSSISEHPGMKHFADGAALRMIPPMMPHEMLKGYAEGTSDVSTSMTSSHSVNIGSMHFATHGITDPDRFVDHVARKLPGVLKTRLPRLSPAAR